MGGSGILSDEIKRNAQTVMTACLDDYNPIRLLKNLQAKIGYNAGYVIRLTDDDRKRISDTIRFHTGD
jgi:hypothetical protein